jgi:hypothetical protein
VIPPEDAREHFACLDEILSEAKVEVEQEYIEMVRQAGGFFYTYDHYKADVKAFLRLMFSGLMDSATTDTAISGMKRSRMIHPSHQQLYVDWVSATKLLRELDGAASKAFAAAGLDRKE